MAVVLKMALGKHAHTAPLKDGSVASDRVRLEFHEFDPLPKAFRLMVRGGDLDVAEMALTTHALAREFGKPLTALPLPVWRRLHHDNLICAEGSDIAGPKDLERRRVGVRAYSQTTGVWIRGILAHDYGVDTHSITFVTIEDAHVSEYVDPPNCVRNQSGKGLREMLLAGEVDAIMGERTPDSAGVRPVIADAEAEAKAWSARTGVFPVNHVVAVKTEVLAQHPWLADELMALFDAARDASGAAMLPYGYGPNAASMQMLLDFAHEQMLTSRRFDVAEIFPTVRAVA